MSSTCSNPPSSPSSDKFLMMKPTLHGPDWAVQGYHIKQPITLDGNRVYHFKELIGDSFHDRNGELMRYARFNASLHPSNTTQAHWLFPYAWQLQWVCVPILDVPWRGGSWNAWVVLMPVETTSIERGVIVGDPSKIRPISIFSHCLQFQKTQKQEKSRITT